MRANRLSACVFAVAASLAGCMGSGSVEYAGDVRISSPDLIEIRPGVQVIADADEPLFYSEGHYWLYRDGYWLRSSSYRGGFARIELDYVPQRVRLIEQPQMYAHYRRHAGRHHASAGHLRTRAQPHDQPHAQPHTEDPEHALPPGQGRLPPGQQAAPTALQGPTGPHGPQSGRGPVVPPGQDRVTPDGPAQTAQPNRWPGEWPER